MNTTDFIILTISVYFFITGWQKGFLRTIFGPISLIIGSLVSYVYFQQTHNLIVSLLIGLIGPFILNFALNLLIKLWRNAHDEKEDFFTLGRVLGAVCNLVWGLAISSILAYLIVLIPVTVPGSKKIQESIKKSHSYIFLNKFFALETKNQKIGVDTIQNILNNPEKMARFQESQTFKELINDEKMKSLLNDEKLMKQIKNNDFGGLIKNPDFIELLKDEELTAKILATYKEILKQNANNNKGNLAN